MHRCVLERDPQLAVLDCHLAQVAAGQGRLALISGEAGVGKTTLVDTWCQRQEGDVRLLRGVCDSSATPRPLVPFIDAFPELTGYARTHEWSRLLATVSEGLQAVGGVPTVLVIEDAHWADGASLDLLRALVMRMAWTDAQWLALPGGPTTGSSADRTSDSSV